MDRNTIFDIDDTIVYTFKNAFRKSELVAREMNVCSPSKDEFSAVYGKYSFEECIRLLHPGINIEEYRKKYDLLRQIIPYEPIGHPDLVMQKLMDDNIGLGILTNGPENKTFLKLEAAGIAKAIREKLLFIFHDGNLEFKKPDSRCFAQAVEKIRKETGRTLDSLNIDYVGDCIDDFTAATGAGINFIGVLSGFTARETFIRAGIKPENLLNSVSELPNYYNI
jgi:phosphoglycolate phosphatase-like HAD superfamily hydrolase